MVGIDAYDQDGEATGRSGDLFPFAGRALPGGNLPGRGDDVYLRVGKATDRVATFLYLRALSAGGLPGRKDNMYIWAREEMDVVGPGQ